MKLSWMTTLVLGRACLISMRPVPALLGLTQVSAVPTPRSVLLNVQAELGSGFFSTATASFTARSR